MHFNALREALQQEHPAIQCGPLNTCTICAAVEEECFVYAANLLIGSAECSKTEKAYMETQASMGLNIEKLYETEHKQVQQLSHLGCPECRAVLYTDADEEDCDSCGAHAKSQAQRDKEAQAEQDFKGGEIVVDPKGGMIRILDPDGNEVVAWADEEWIEDPQVVYAIVNAVKLFYDEGADAVRARMQALRRTGRG